MTKNYPARGRWGWLGVALAALLPAAPRPAAAQAGAAVAPPGVYRTAAQFRQRRPAPAAIDVRSSEKRNALAATAQRGLTQVKIFVPRDSAWGYANAKGHAYRVAGPLDYRIEQADTLTVYSRNDAEASNGVRAYTARRYFFSRGLGGLVFPLTTKMLREAFEAGNPAFVAALRGLPFGQELSARNKETGEFRVVKLFREQMAK